MFTNHHVKSLREELISVHDAYKKQIWDIDAKRIDGLRDLELCEKVYDDIKLENERLIEANLRLGTLVEQTEKDAEKWKEAALKYEYLCEQMDRVGLKQSDDIFDCHRDIVLPPITEREKNRYVTTHLTGTEIVEEVEGIDEEIDEVIDEGIDEVIDLTVSDSEDYDIQEIIQRITDNVNDNVTDDNLTNDNLPDDYIEFEGVSELFDENDINLYYEENNDEDYMDELVYRVNRYINLTIYLPRDDQST